MARKQCNACKNVDAHGGRGRSAFRHCNRCDCCTPPKTKKGWGRR